MSITINNDDRWEEIRLFEDMIAQIETIIENAGASIKVNNQACMNNLALAMESIHEKDTDIWKDARELKARIQSLRAVKLAEIRQDYE